MTSEPILNHSPSPPYIITVAKCKWYKDCILYKASGLNAENYKINFEFALSAICVYGTKSFGSTPTNNASTVLPQSQLRFPPSDWHSEFMES